jgi:asparaginyl-tRNA synthetase
MVHAAHAFFPTNGFFNVNAPITTATATTVAGDRCSKMFRVMQLKIDQIVHTVFLEN